jgi:hypothetical protein
MSPVSPPESGNAIKKANIHCSILVNFEIKNPLTGWLAVDAGIQVAQEVLLTFWEVVVAATAEAGKRFPGRIPVPLSLATGISLVQTPGTWRGVN